MEQTTPARRAYPSDLRDGEWAILEPLVPAVKPGGRPARWSRREIVNGILYVVRGGNQWRAMPHDLPPWQTVYYYFRIWRNDGTWEAVHTALRERARQQIGREPTPSAAILDSQSVKTTQRGAAWLRQAQGHEGAQTPPARRQPGLPAQGRRLGRRCAGPGWRAPGGPGAAPLRPGPASPLARLGRRRLRRRVRAGTARAVRLDHRDRQ